MTKAIDWLYENDWRMLGAIVGVQITLVVAFLWFATWISAYAIQNWY